MISVEEHPHLNSEWVHQHGERMLAVRGKPTTSFGTTKGFQCLPVCMYLTTFQATITIVKICTSQEDQDTASDPKDTRYKDWWSVPIAHLTKLPGVGEELAAHLKPGNRP